MRKPVQLLYVPETGVMRPAVLALCDDGVIFSATIDRHGYTEEWERWPAIPQDPEPVADDPPAKPSTPPDLDDEIPF